MLSLLLGAPSRFPDSPHVIMMIPGEMSCGAERDAGGDTKGKEVDPNKKQESNGKKKSKKKLSKKERFVGKCWLS